MGGPCTRWYLVLWPCLYASYGHAYYAGACHGYVPLRGEPPVDARLVEVMPARQQQYLVLAGEGFHAEAALLVGIGRSGPLGPLVRGQLGELLVRVRVRARARVRVTVP